MKYYDLEFKNSGGQNTGWANVNSAPNDPLYKAQAALEGKNLRLRGALFGPRGVGKKVIARLPGPVPYPDARVGFVVSAYRTDLNQQVPVSINVYPNGEIAVVDFQLQDMASTADLYMFLDGITFPVSE